MLDSPFSLANTAKAIHATLDDAFAAIPDGKRHVVLFDATHTQEEGFGARVVYAERTTSGWGIVGQLAYDKPHGIAGKVATAKSW